MRLIHAVRELNAEGGAQIETVALHTDGESAAKFVREADAAYALGPASARPYLDHAVLERALRETERRRRVGRVGVRRRGPRLRRALRAAGRDVHRAERGRDAPAGRQDRREAARRGGRRPRRTVEPGSRRRRRGGRRARARDRLPPDAQGDGRRRRARHPGGDLRRGAGRGLPADERRGVPCVRQRRRVPRAPGHRRPAHRGADHRRRTGHGLGARRPGLLAAATQPEGHRGVRLPGAGRQAGPPDQGGGRAARPRRRLPRRGHGRVPVRARRARASPSSR